MTQGTVTFTVAGQSASASYTVSGAAPSLAIGMNYSSTAAIAQANAAYEPRATVARIYVDDGRTNISQEPEYVRARDNGITTLVLSWKDTNVQWLGTVPSECRWYGVRNHEPEELTATAWKAMQAHDMPLVVARGGIPTAIFTSYSLNNPNNHAFNLADWKCPPGTHAALGGDYYPDKEPAFTQAQVIAHQQTAMATFGVSRFIYGEYGVINGDASGPGLIAEFKSLLPANVEAAAYWSSQASGKPNYKFSAATAAAWFA